MATLKLAPKLGLNLSDPSLSGYYYRWQSKVTTHGKVYFNSVDLNQIGITISKKVLAKATDRNQHKRWFKEAFRSQNKIGQYIFHLKKPCQDYDEVITEIKSW